MLFFTNGKVEDSKKVKNAAFHCKKGKNYGFL
jgi:hypothetical protein